MQYNIHVTFSLQHSWFFFINVIFLFYIIKSEEDHAELKSVHQLSNLQDNLLLFMISRTFAQLYEILCDLCRFHKLEVIINDFV